MLTEWTQTALYVETSAVLAWIFGEPAGEHAVTVMNSISPVVSSAFTVDGSSWRFPRRFSVALPSILAFLELYDDMTVVSFDSRILDNIALLGISAA